MAEKRRRRRRKKEIKKRAEKFDESIKPKKKTSSIF